MRSSTETYHEVAERCSAYEKTCHCNSMTNKADGEKSCLNCSHFSKDEHCKLDPYDPIVKESDPDEYNVRSHVTFQLLRVRLPEFQEIVFETMRSPFVMTISTPKVARIPI